MRTTKLLGVIALNLLLAFSACKKNEDPKATPTPTPAPTPTAGPYASLAKAFEEVAPKSKTVTINAAVGGSFYGLSGTRYNFLPNSFVNSAGAVVTGNIDIEVLECTTEADMIFGKMLTVSNGTPLISAGEVNVKATQSGAALYIRPGYTYSVNMPTNKGLATAGMEYFTGESSTLVNGSIVNWNLGIRKDSLAAVVYNGDTISMFPDSVGFKNLDKYASSDFADVDIKIDGFNPSLNQEDFTSYILLDGLLSAAPMIGKSLSGDSIKTTRILKLKSHLVFCGVYKGDFYGGILRDVTVVAGNTYTITASKMTPPAFKALINALN